MRREAMLIWIKNGPLQGASIKLMDLRLEHIGRRGKYEKEGCSPPRRAAARRRNLKRGHGGSDHF